MLGVFKSLFADTKNQELLTAIRNGAFMVDVRTPAEFAADRVAGAINIPLDKIPHRLSQFNEKDMIVVFCKSGGRSAQAKDILEQRGFQNVINGGSRQKVRQHIKEATGVE